MFRFHRKGKSRSAEKQKKKTNDTLGIEPTLSQNVGTLPKAVDNEYFENPPPEVTNLDGFLDHVSIDTSLYTTPSRTTIQYPDRHAPINYGIDWESTQGSEDEGQGTRFTAELALDQYKLGGWQAPPSIELAPTPSTAESSNTSSRALSPAPSVSHREEEQQEETRERTDTDSYNKVFRSGWVKHPQIPTCLHTADYDSLVFEHVRDTYLEAQSAASTEISWNFDSRAYREKLSPEVVTPSPEPTMPAVPQNVATNVRTPARDDEESACTSVSSIYTNGFCHDTPRSNISAWSPTASPVDHVILKEDEESSCHDLYDGGASQGAEYDEVSFSELISRCEEESLAERLAPHYILPPKRLFGTTIDTNSLGSFPDSLSNLSRTETRNQESAYEAKLSTPKENRDGGVVAPKKNDTNPQDLATSHKEELDVPKIEVESNQNDSPTVQSTPEAQNLNVQVEPIAPEALSKQHDFETINDVDCDKENHESYKSNEQKILPQPEKQETRILVETNELPASGAEPQNDLDQSESVNSEKTFHFVETSYDSSIFVPGKRSYFGPVDLDESFSSSEDDEDVSKWRRQSENQGRHSCVDTAVAISPIAASKRDTQSMSPSQASFFLSQGAPTRHENSTKGRQAVGVWEVEQSVKSSPVPKNVRVGSRPVVKEPYQHAFETPAQKNVTPSRKTGKWNPFTRLKNKKEKEGERNIKLTPTSFNKSRKATPGDKAWNRQSRTMNHGSTRPHKGSQEGNLYYSTPVKSRTPPTTTTTKGSDFSANSNLHKDFSFDTPRTSLSLTRSPKTVTTLPPCRLCKTAERTHIALPCMHYSFCSECAESLQGLKIPTCPICQTQKITLSRVYL